MSLKRFFASGFISLLFLLSGSVLAFQNAQSELLSTPKKSLHTFLHWQQTGHLDLGKAALTMKLLEGTEEERIELATELKKVLDARGLLVEYEAVPNTRNYVDSLSGLQQYILFDELPEVYLTKTNNEWVFSKATIEQIPELYRDTFSSLVEAVVGELPESLKKDWFGIQIWQYIAIFCWLLLGLIFRKIFEFILENYIHKLAKKTKFTWDDDLIDGIDKPSGFIFMMFFWLATFTNFQLSVTVNHYLSLILEIAVSVGFIWLFYNLSDVFSKYLGVLTSKTETKLDDQLVPLIRKTLRFFVLLMGVILILQNNGYNVASLIAGLGIGGLAVALAARDTLANFFGSITIFVDKPFRIGDWIKVAGVEGTVEEVGFRSTRIRTFYNSLVSVPNSNISNNEVDNLGLREYRRLLTTLNLTYSTSPEQMEAFVEGIKAIVKSNPHFRQDFYEVHFNAFGAHSLDVMVYVFFKVPDWSTELQQKHNFFLEVLKLAKEVGVEFAFPTQTLHVDSFHKDEPRQVGEPKTEEELAASVTEYGPNGSKSNPDGLRIFKDGKEVDFGSGK
ncbi:MAG: mechanosensitive ion channel family protein [Balneola sp.]|nr:mechanosensitive ion channel family protein [Balneola sp.]MBO6652282.1 mechanosensitive ion channel family protein [Balneola sp.]MBO6712722.1 mechanosensitive ion channel family protein [Balneola sp.]MBO6801384.1 mechanosensitive ion channel family protein [Balneola sp.]MBO6870457.1 mechanosensitive ion channel family protein [Balneola sp.]